MAQRVTAKLAVEIAANTAKFAQGIKDAQNQLLGFTQSVRGLGGLIGASFGAAAVVQGIRSVIGTLSDFESTMSEVKAITGAVGDEFRQLERDSLRLGRTSKFTATQVGQLQVAFGRLGFSTKEILQATEATVQLATATGEDLAKSADVAGSTVRGFGLDASETQRVVDVMASSFNKTALGLENFTESMKYVAPVAAAAGASVEETTALLGVLADAGIRGSMAGTSLRKIFTDLSKDGRPLRVRLQELAEKGITLSDAMDEVGRTAQTSLLILSKNTSKADELAQAFQNVEGEAAKVARIMGDNLTGDVTRLTAAWDGLILKVAQSDPWRKAVQNITGVINAISGTKDLQDRLNILARSISEGLGRGGLDELGAIIEGAREARKELGKPIDIAQVEELATKYRLTSAQANILYQAILDVNKAMSFQEKAIQEFRDFAERNGYTDLSEAARVYRDRLYELIVAQQIEKEQFEKGMEATDDADAFYRKEIENNNGRIATYRRLIIILNDYVGTLAKQHKAEDQIQQVVVENRDLYQKMQKDVQDAFGKTSVLDGQRLRILASENAALEEKINKLNRILKLATQEAQIKPRKQTGQALEDQVISKDFDPLDNFFNNNQEKIQKLRDSLTGLKEHIITLDLGGQIGSAVADMAFAFGQASVGVEKFGTAILASVVGFAKQLGEILVASGFAMLAAKKLVKSPGLAIAAGLTLLAISGAASAALQKSQSSYNSGGTSSTSGRDVAAGVTESSRSMQIHLTADPIVIRGQDAYIIMKAYEQNKGYTSTVNG